MISKRVINAGMAIIILGLIAQRATTVISITGRTSIMPGLPL